MSLSTMNYELIEKVEGAIYIFNDERKADGPVHGDNRCTLSR